MKIKYAPKDSGCLPENAYELEVSDPNPSVYGPEIAEDYYYYHDGWESDWPIVFEVWSMDNQKIEEIEADRKVSPIFNVKTLKPPQ
jgi:hypothetical protein